MALYRFETSNLSRAKGQSAIARAAYNSRSNLKDHRTGEPKDYRYKEGVEFTGIFAPKDAPEWVHDREKLWNEVERVEDASTRRNQARTARDFKLALPWELDKQQREWLVKDFAREMSRKGMVVDVAIHEPEHDKSDERNYHVHMLCTTREIGPNGFGKKNRDWNRKEELEGWRERWAKLGAKHLERAGQKLEAERFGVAHKTLHKQKEAAVNRGDWDAAKMLDREPTVHMGPNATAMERRGIPTMRGDENRETVGRNFARLHGLSIPPRLKHAFQRTAIKGLEFAVNILEMGVPIMTPEQKAAGRKADREKAFAAQLAEEERQRAARRSHDRDR